MIKRTHWILLAIFIILGIAFAGLYFWYESGNLQKKVISTISSKISNDKDSTASTTNVLQEILGITSDKHYLFLFLNNTELRPGGGFIGVYGVIKASGGKPEVIKVEGTEIIDNNAPKDFVFNTPKPLADYLDIKRMEFRDSNWSPDFASSSRQALELYKLENGVLADKIDAVIGITPTVIEEVLKITGPIEYQGMTFNADNFTKDLEYEVEYGFKDKGINFSDRKKILIGLTHALTKKLTIDVLFNWSDYYEMVNRMVDQKQVMVYSINPSAQSVLEGKKAGGRIYNTNSDYLLWVDANLGALKTDATLKRELSYSFKQDDKNKDKYRAIVTMKYIHNGIFDWRTTRYRTYSRIFVPSGSELISVKGSKDNKIDQGMELGKKWFGTFAIIEPQTTREVSFEYYVDKKVIDTMKNNTYSLLVQKQLGSIDNKLKLDLDFKQKINSATPGEDKKYHGDNKYIFNTDLTVDRIFKIKLAQ